MKFEIIEFSTRHSSLLKSNVYKVTSRVLLVFVRIEITLSYYYYYGNNLNFYLFIMEITLSLDSAISYYIVIISVLTKPSIFKYYDTF